MSVLSPPPEISREPVRDRIAAGETHRVKTDQAGLATSVLRKAVLAKLRPITGGSITVIDGEARTYVRRSQG